MAYRIEIDEDALDDIADIGPFYGNAILDAIEEQLTHEPAKETRRKKMLEGVDVPWSQVGPVWQLRVGEFRVFYDVIEPGEDDEDEVDEPTVFVRAVRHKPPHKTTDEML